MDVQGWSVSFCLSTSGYLTLRPIFYTINLFSVILKTIDYLYLQMLPYYFVYTGLKLRVRNENLIFLFLNQNICCGYSKEPSQ